MSVLKEYKVFCTGSTDLTINSRGFLTMHDMINHDEWLADEASPLTVKPLREELGYAYMCPHQIDNLIEVLKLVSLDLEASELRRKKINEKAVKEAKAKIAAKKTTKKTKAKKVKKK